MLTIKILGSGCANCKKLEQIARQAVDSLNIESEIIKVTDMKDIMAYDRISAKLLGSDVVNLRYLHKGERSPVAWYLTWYRPPAMSGQNVDWVVITLRFDKRIEELEP